jgi:hypothetical protein
MNQPDLITLMQDNKFKGFVKLALAEIISNYPKKAGHTVERFNQKLQVFTK